jgi:hypothetical protein
MENDSEFEALKRDAIARVWNLDDPVLLRQIIAVLKGEGPTPTYVLDLIDQGLAESKAGFGTPIEDFLKEIEDL